MKCSEIDNRFPKWDKIFTLLESRPLSSHYLSMIYVADRLA